MKCVDLGVQIEKVFRLKVKKRRKRNGEMKTEKRKR